MQINAAKFRAQCLKLLDEVQLTKNELIIMKHGKPVAKLVAFEESDAKDRLIGGLKGAGKTCADLTLPFEDEWDLDA